MEFNKPIGILGGTFDPIHLGHIYLSLEVLKKTNLEYIKFLPSYQPVHRQSPHASVEDRLNMLRIAIQNYSQFTLDTREIERQGASFMIDTMYSLHQELPTTPLCLIIGQDAFNEFHTWKNWRQLLSLCHLIIVNRPQTPAVLNTELKELIAEQTMTDPQQLSQKLAGGLLFLQIEPIPISATEVRNRIKKNVSLRGLVPDSVAHYIQQQQLYR